jgi:hypothetical protein
MEPAQPFVAQPAAVAVAATPAIAPSPSPAPAAAGTSGRPIPWHKRKVEKPAPGRESGEGGVVGFGSDLPAFLTRPAPLRAAED